MRPLATWSVAIAGPFLLLVAAGCSSGPSDEEQQELSAALEQVTGTVLHAQEEATALSAAVDQVASDLEEVEGFTNALILDASRVGPDRSKFLPDPPEGMVTVQLLGEVLAAKIPGEFTFHLAAPEVAQLFTTESIPAGQEFPVGQQLDKGVAFVEPGKLYTLQVVYRNPTAEEVRFLVAAPTLDPQAALPFARARCWCAAVPFSAPPNGAFFRTIEVGVAPDTPPGAKAIVLWPVIRLDES